MDNDQNQKLDVLTNQTVSFQIGKQTFRARRVTLKDVGSMNAYKKQLEDAGQTGNVDMDCLLYVLYEVMKNYNPTDVNGQLIASSEDLASSVLFEDTPDLLKAVEAVGLKTPQTLQDQTTPKETGA